MTLGEAIQLIRTAVPGAPSTWADLGAGTGLFTLALRELLPAGLIYAVDKSPHALWRLDLAGPVEIRITEADFTQPMDLPLLDGILMANALHYAPEPERTLSHLLTSLQPGGIFILVEYEREQPLPPWIPYPLPFHRWQALATAAGLTPPEKTGALPSSYGHREIYAAVSHKKAK